MDRPKGCSLLLRAYDLDFDQVALNPKATLEEKIDLLVLLRHTWVSADRQDVFCEDVPDEQLKAEKRALFSEIGNRLPDLGFVNRYDLERQIDLPSSAPKLVQVQRAGVEVYGKAIQ